ncbi:MAG TPA: TPM domain-containing protein [Dongiaceae bacterium]|jgi:putative membrane protein
MLSQQHAQRIEQAVKEAEAATSSEIAVCILPASGDDRGTAAIAAVIVFAIVKEGAPLLWWGLDPLLLTGAALAAAIVVFWLVDRFDLGLRCLPARLLVKDARRAARAAFLDHALDNSEERNAVMLFVSRAERYIEILPDRAAAAAIEQSHWNSVVEEFRRRMKASDLGDAVAGAVSKIGALCALHFPASAANPDRVPNQPIQS